MQILIRLCYYTVTVSIQSGNRGRVAARLHKISFCQNAHSSLIVTNSTYVSVLYLLLAYLKRWYCAKQPSVADFSSRFTDGRVLLPRRPTHTKNEAAGARPSSHGGASVRTRVEDRADTADHFHKDATDRYAPCLQILLLFARAVVNIGDCQLWPAF